jgi:hypothetical protein
MRGEQTSNMGVFKNFDLKQLLNPPLLSIVQGYFEFNEPNSSVKYR